MKTITVFKGDGIGPEICDATLQILKAAKAPLAFECFEVGEAEYERNGKLIPDGSKRAGLVVSSSGLWYTY